MNARVFTLDEANRILSVVRKTFLEAKDLRSRISSRTMDFEFMQIGDEGSGGGSSSLTKIKTEIRDLNASFTKKMALLEAMGAQVKQFDPGVIDFFAIRDGRVVLLCWQEGETEIAYWHELDAGFQGRKPV